MENRLFFNNIYMAHVDFVTPINLHRKGVQANKAYVKNMFCVYINVDTCITNMSISIYILQFRAANSY